MFAPTTEEIKGTFHEFPFAELLLEAVQSRLSGSFRLAHLEEKAIIYLKNGEVIFAVSNLRQHRLFEVLLQTGKISRETLADIPNLTNDLELGQNLVAKELLTKSDIDELFTWQIEGILVNVLQWQTGAWSFSHLARVKEGIEFKIGITNLLFNYARTLSNSYIQSRFRSFEEKFALSPSTPQSISLPPAEGYLLARIEGMMRIQEIKATSGLPENETLKALYMLWCGGFLIRKNWNSAFSESKIREILTAKLTLKTSALATAPSNLETVSAETPAEENGATRTEEIIVDERQLLEEYLKRIEEAESYYEMLEVTVKVPASEIKNAYFGLAKQYHPDKYHQESDAKIQQRVQNAFTELARAYDTLKDDKARELYDFKLRKYLESIKDNPTIGATVTKGANASDMAREEFDQGFELLMNNSYQEALPYLTRAAQLSPQTSRYRAYLGKALSADGSQRHKAESEIQAAIKLEAENPTYRIMLVEFFLQYNLLKRAEGELQRILTTFPGNKEAEAILENLRS